MARLDVLGPAFNLQALLALPEPFSLQLPVRLRSWGLRVVAHSLSENVSVCAAGMRVRTA